LEKEIRKMVRETLAAAGMDMEVRREHCGINMSYHFIFHYVGFDPIRIQTAIQETSPAVTLEQYVKTFALHELGHALDRQALLDSLDRTAEIYKMKQRHTKEEIYASADLLGMLVEEHVMNLKFEETAWNHAEHLNRVYAMVDWPVFRQLKKHGLLTYQTAYEKDLLLYEKMLSAQPA
jgi:hypothetical protein